MENKGSRIYLILISVCFAVIASLCGFCSQSRFVAIAKESDAKCVAHFIDVGQGDSIFIELPDNRCMLIDAGPTSAGETVVNYIKQLNYSTIDYLLLTHSDEDHSGGMVSVFENFEIKTIFRPFVLSVNATILPENEELYGKYDSSQILTVTTNVYAKFIKYAYLETYGDNILSDIYFSYDGITRVSSNTSLYAIEFHTPPIAENVMVSSTRAIGYPTKLYDGSEANKKNSVSPIVSLEIDGGIVFLFCGDATQDTEQDFLANLPRSSRDALTSVDLLKVAHHGSVTSSSEEFINLVAPTRAIVMCGKDNKYNLPNTEVLDRIEATWLGSRTEDNKIFRTDENGSIVVTVGVDNSIKTQVASVIEDDALKIQTWVIYVAIGLVVLVIVICLVLKWSKKKKITKKDFKHAASDYSSSKKAIRKAVRKINKK